MIYRYGLGFVFYARGVIYFISTVFFQEKTKILEFIMHVVSISIGTAIVFNSQFDASFIGIFFLIMSIIGAAILTVDGYGGYKKYRLAFKNDEKQLENQPKKEKTLPLEDPQEERTYIN